MSCREHQTPPCPPFPSRMHRDLSAEIRKRLKVRVKVSLPSGHPRLWWTWGEERTGEELRRRVFGVRAEVLSGGGRRRKAPGGVRGQGGRLGLQPHQGRARAGPARAVPMGTRAPALPLQGPRPCLPLLCTLQLACDMLAKARQDVVLCSAPVCRNE